MSLEADLSRVTRMACAEMLRARAARLDRTPNLIGVDWSVDAAIARCQARIIENTPAGADLPDIWGEEEL